MMPFVPRAPKIPTTPEELFVLKGSEAFLVASLSDGTKLFLSDGPAHNYPSPWPLWYEPFTIIHTGALAWFEERRAKTLELRPDLEGHYIHIHKRGLGVYYPISALALGEYPYLQNDIWRKNSNNSNREVINRAVFTFDARIVKFIPVSSREEARSIQ